MSTTEPRTGALDEWAEAAEARWTAIAVDRPDLEASIALQRRLLGRSLDLTRTLERRRLPEWAVPDRHLCAKLHAGVPALRGEHIALPADVLEPALLESCVDLSRGGAGDAASHVHDVLRQRRIDPGSLLVASLARDQDAIRMTALHAGLSPDLVWLVAELAVGPAAFVLQRRFLGPRGNGRTDAVRAALAGWNGTGCPACGSWPALAEIRGGCRELRCSFCGTAWRPPVLRCAYCDGHERGSFQTVIPDSREGSRRLELCDGCHGYLKAVDVAEATPGPLLPIADLATTALDFAATGQGYGRPPLPTIARGDPCC